jgi:hypothetical protein
VNISDIDIIVQLYYNIGVRRAREAKAPGKEREKENEVQY